MDSFTLPLGSTRYSGLLAVQRRGRMGALRSGYWTCLAVLVLLATSISTSDTAALPNEDDTYRESSLREVMEIPSTGMTRVCVVPKDSTPRLKVLHTDAEGGMQEVAVRRRALTQNRLSILEIEVQTGDDSKPSLSVRLNGTELPQQESLSTASPASQQPRTALLLKGHATITLCTPPTNEQLPAPEGRGKEKPQDGGKQTVTPGQEGAEVTPTSTSPQPPVTTDDASFKATTEQTVTPSTSPEPPVTTDDASLNATTEETESVEEDPWWSFLLVLGKVGEVPVLALLLGAVVLGSLVGGCVVCLCWKACRKPRGRYKPVPVRMTPSMPPSDLNRGTRTGDRQVNDFIRPKQVGDRADERSSGIGSNFSTLTNDRGSTNSVDHGQRSGTPFIANNLGRGTTGSLSGSTGRGHISANNSFNIPNNDSTARWDPATNTHNPDNRVAESSLMLPPGGGRPRTYSNRSNGGSINRNTNRSPNIPYTKTLGAIAGHQDTSIIQNHNSDYDDDWDDDPRYDKPYVSPPIVADYSVPHSTQVVQLQKPNNTLPSDKPGGRQLPPGRYATFVK